MHILQSPAWDDFQKSLGHKTFTDSGDGWSYLAILQTSPLGPYLMVPHGPSLAKPQDLTPALTSLKSLAKSQKAIFIRIEPSQNIPPRLRKSFKKVKATSPEHTWILDLAPDKSALLAGMKQNNRNLWANHAKKGLKITRTTDPSEVHHLYSLLQQVARHNNIHTQSEDYLKKQLQSGFATLYLVHYEGKVIAASLVYDYGDTRYYGHAAADHAHRKLSAGTVLVAQMILDAKAEGRKFFDFWGITPSEDPKHPWYGFTKFKKSFGGEQITYPGTYDLVLSRPKYTLYSLLRPVNFALRRLIKPR